jgi:hypothetical protein
VNKSRQLKAKDSKPIVLRPSQSPKELEDFSVTFDAQVEQFPVLWSERTLMESKSIVGVQHHIAHDNTTVAEFGSKTPANQAT